MQSRQKACDCLKIWKMLEGTPFRMNARAEKNKHEENEETVWKS